MSPRGRMMTGGVLLACLVLAPGGGCARTRIEGPTAPPVTADDADAELDFWDALAQRPLASNDDGLHAMFLLADQADPRGTYEERLRDARARGWVTGGFDEPGDLAIQRGTLARAVAVHCGIEGGVMMRVSGVHPRYATRELQYMGLLGSGSEQQALSGREVIGVIGKAQEYLEARAAQARDASALEEPASGTAPSAPPVPRVTGDEPH